MQVDIPFPVPLHACFIKRRGGGGVPTKRYQAYATEAGWMIRTQKPKPVEGPVSVVVRLVAPDRRARDADNHGKCVLDTLTRHSLIADDSNRVVRRLTFEWIDSGPPCRVIVSPYREGLL